MSFKIISNAGNTEIKFYKSIYTSTNNQSVTITAGNTGDLSFGCTEGIILYSFDFTLENKSTSTSSTILIEISKGASKGTAVNIQDYTYSDSASDSLNRVETLTVETDFNNCLFIDVTVSQDTLATLKTTFTRLPKNRL